MINWDPESEHQAGILCEEGFMKEYYDSRLDELVRIFTKKGIKKIKIFLKDPKYQKSFIQMLYNEIHYFPKETQVGIINEIKTMLKNGKN